MKRKLLFAALPLVFAAGCSNAEMYEARIRDDEWRIDAAQKQAEQAEIDKKLAQKEVELARNKNSVLSERLALAYDALREARTKLDEGLADRMTELSESSTTGQSYQISQYGGIVLESGIFFASGSHQLSSKGEEALKAIVGTLGKSDYADYEIELAGHTDSDVVTRSANKYRDNHDLAAMRANSVRRFLVENGVPTDRVYTAAWGPNHPLGGGDKAKDRRVEILLHKKGEPTTTLPASAKASIDATSQVRDEINKR